MLSRGIVLCAQNRCPRFCSESSSKVQKVVEGRGGRSRLGRSVRSVEGRGIRGKIGVAVLLFQCARSAVNINLEQTYQIHRLQRIMSNSCSPSSCMSWPDSPSTAPDTSTCCSPIPSDIIKVRDKVAEGGFMPTVATAPMKDFDGVLKDLDEEKVRSGLVRIPGGIRS
jgi:hypothetical protein